MLLSPMVLWLWCFVRWCNTDECEECCSILVYHTIWYTSFLERHSDECDRVDCIRLICHRDRKNCQPIAGRRGRIRFDIGSAPHYVCCCCGSAHPHRIPIDVLRQLRIDSNIPRCIIRWSCVCHPGTTPVPWQRRRRRAIVATNLDGNSRHWTT